MKSRRGISADRHARELRPVLRPASAIVAAAALAALLLGTAACDSVTQTVACAAFSEFDVGVDLAGSVVQPEIGTVVTSTASGRSDIPDVELRAIGVTADQLTFEGTGSGSVAYVFAVNDTVIGYGTAAVTDGSITAAPGTMVIGDATQAQVSSVLNTVPSADRPSWALVSPDLARAVVTRAAQSSQFTISSAVSSTGDVEGEGSIQEVTFYLEC